MFDSLIGKKKVTLSGTVERVGFVGFAGDVHYMTFLLKGSNQIFRVYFSANTDDGNAISLTQTGDQVSFSKNDFGNIQATDFQNTTIAARLQQPEPVLG